MVLGAAVAAFGFANNAQALSINEIRIDDDSTDTDEYFELVGNAGESLNNVYYLVIGDGNTGSGTIEYALDLTGNTVASDGFFLAGQSTLGTDVTFTDTLDLIEDPNFENSDNVTHVLVTGFTGASGDDLDTNDDGTLDSTPWTTVLDAVGLVETVGSGEQVYGTALGGVDIGPNGTFVPAHVFRTGDAGTSFAIGDFTGSNDTPGVTNIPEPASLALLGLGGLSLMGRGRRRLV